MANLVLDDVFINRNQNKTLRLCLSNQHPIKWVSVNGGQPSGNLAMKEADW